jgi:hypothetical protein
MTLSSSSHANPASSHHAEPVFLTQDPAAIPPSRYTWILHILSYAPPSLTSICMTDPPGRIEYCYWATAQWSPPKDIGDVELDVQMSLPNPGYERENLERAAAVEARRARPRKWGMSLYGEMDPREFEYGIR